MSRGTSILPDEEAKPGYKVFIGLPVSFLPFPPVSPCSFLSGHSLVIATHTGFLVLKAFVAEWDCG